MLKKVFNFVFVIIVFLLLCISITNTARTNKYRGLCDKYREQLITTETTNRELNNRLSRIAEVVGKISETTRTNITDARGIVETVERLRTEVQELENICYSNDSIDDYYNYWDNIYGLQ